MKDFLNKYFNKENFKKAAAWCIANRRFFIAALLFVLLLVLLRACTGQSASEENSGSEANSGTEQQTETESTTNFALDSDFEMDAHEEVNSLIAAYYEAFAAADMDTLETLATPISENEKSYIGVFSQYIESYENIVCYTKSGLTDGSYLVSAYFDLKFYDVETVAPGLDFFYVETKDDGSVYINNLYSAYNLNRTENEMDPNIYAAILQFEEQEDSEELRTKVEDAYTEALASDVDLATMLSTTIPNAMTDWLESISNSADSNTEEEGTESQTEQDTESTTEAEGGDDTAQEENPADDGDDTAQEETPADEGGDDTAQEETPADEGNDDTAKKKKKKVVKVKITSDIVNVRESASTSSEIIGKATKGEKYTELDYADGWFKISFNGTDGYVKSDYVTEVKE
jgi:hypothetical protein